MADSEELHMYDGRLMAMAARYANLGETLGDAALVKKLPDTVPDRLFPVVAGIEQFHDVTTMAFDEALGRLRAFDEHASTARQRRVGGQTAPVHGGAVASAGAAARRSTGRCIMALGSGGNRRCYKCGEHGHIRRECPQLRKGPAAEQALLADANVDNDGLL
ncbi:unnamed protein product [Triticum aestivum]|uniref:CCHC-type domain-containing protein n=1 Tax=Triticum aestivum TaxID=4565 RepID=A0A7H4LL56_WHEAT|nr:unnamed protein product [Triticum aestivum]